MIKTPWTEWRVCGIFAPEGERQDVVNTAIAEILHTENLEQVVWLASKRAGRGISTLYLEDMSTKRGNVLMQAIKLINPHTLLVFDDIETIRKYPQSMTRNIINHLAPLTPYKIIAGGALVVKELADLYAPWAVLDKRILHANHYWCFAEDHREVSVFDSKSIVANKDMDYLAAKLRPFVYFNLESENDVQAPLYDALRAAPYHERIHDITMLRL